MKVWLDRKEYADEATLGDIYVDGVFECVSLEDEIAIGGKKDPGNTCIPEGTYELVVMWSPRFKRRLPLLVDVPGFDGIRIHPGNTVDDTSGCLLVGEKIIQHQGRPFLTHSTAAFDRLYAKLSEADGKGERITLEVMP